MKRARLVLILVLIFTSSYAYSQLPPAKVKAVEVFEQEIAHTNKIVGILDFDKCSEISSELSGLIKKEIITEGIFVKKGDVLFELNTDFIKKDIEIKKKRKRALGNKNLQRIKRFK